MGDSSTHFDDAPRQSEFWENDKGTYLNDEAEAYTKGAENFIGIKQYVQTTDFIDKGTTALEGLFEGEATFNELFDAVDSGLSMAVGFIEAAEFISAIASIGEDPGGYIGALLGNVASMGMTFLLEYIQPIQDLVGILTGNPERIRTSASMWDTLAGELAAQAPTMSEQANRLQSAWRDDASEAAGLRIGEGNNILLVALQLSTGVATALEFTASVFEKIQGYLMSRISDIIGIVMEFVIGGVPKWPKLLIDAVPMLLRITIELFQIALHVARALGARPPVA